MRNLTRFTMIALLGVLPMPQLAAQDTLIFTWNEEVGKTYNLLGNADLSTAPSTWATVLPGVTSPQTIPMPVGTRFFYAVQEAP